MRAWKEGEHKSVYIGAPKSAAGVRTASLPRGLADDLKGHVAGMDAEAFVFTSLRGRRLRLSWFRTTVWLPAIKKLAQKPRIHDLRHSYGSNLMLNGTPLYVVQELMGHESIETTRKIYIHLDGGAGERATAAAAESLKLLAPVEPASVSPVVAMLEGVSEERQREILAALSVIMRAA